MQWAQFKFLQTLWENTFLDHECPWKNHSYSPQKFHLGSLQFYQNLLFSFKNRFNRIWNRFNRFLYWSFCHLCPASLIVKSCQKSRVQRFFENRFNQFWAQLNRFWVRSSLRLSSSVNRELPGGNRFNRFKNWFNRFLVHFSQRLPAFGGSFKYPHSLSPHSLLPFQDFLADQPLNKGIHFTSHTRNRTPFNRLKDPWCEVKSI
jgi:hypothetical protein